MTQVSFRIDEQVKTDAEKALKAMGLNLSTAITIFLTKVGREQRIPFEIRRNIPNRETIEALNEFSQMKSDKFAYKRYNSFNDIIKEACEENVEYRPVK